MLPRPRENRATKTAKRHVFIPAAIAISLVMTVAGCGGHATELEPHSSQSAGNYPTTPQPWGGVAGNIEGAQESEAARLAEVLIDPFDVDSSLTKSCYPQGTFSSRAVAAGVGDAAATSPAVARALAVTKVCRLSPGTGNDLTIIGAIFPDPDAASTAVSALVTADEPRITTDATGQLGTDAPLTYSTTDPITGTSLSSNSISLPLNVPGADASLVVRTTQTQTGKPTTTSMTVSAYAEVGRVVTGARFHLAASPGSVNPGETVRRAAEFLVQQRADLQTFVPTPLSTLGSLHRHQTALQSAAIPGETNVISAKTYAVKGAEHWLAPLDRWRPLLDRAGVSAIAIDRSIVMEAASDVRANTLATHIIPTLWTATVPLRLPNPIAGATCYSIPLNDQNTNADRYACSLVEGARMALVTSNHRTDIAQLAAAQQLLLARTKQ